MHPLAHITNQKAGAAKPVVVLLPDASPGNGAAKDWKD
jgi:hypothetical protein